MSASVFADDTTEILNGQINLNAEVNAQLRVDAGETGEATVASAAMANALNVETIAPHDVESTQEFSGFVTSDAETSVVSVDGTALTASTAMGNAVTMDMTGDSDINATQTAGDGSNVYAGATLRVASYANSSVTASNAAANAIEVNAEGGSIIGQLRQDSGAFVRAETVIDAPNAGMGWTAAVAATASGNSIQTSGYDTSTILDVEQANRGEIRAAARMTAGGGSRFTTVASQAQGNGLSVQNNYGYAHAQGGQDNSGNAEAVTDIELGNFDQDSIFASSESMGNSALLSNIGGDVFLGLDQNNTGRIDSTTRFTGDDGGEVIGSASAFGNALTGYTCNECPNTQATGEVNQTNSGAVNSTFQATQQTGWGITGGATAVGNSASFVTTSPYSDD